MLGPRALSRTRCDTRGASTSRSLSADLFDIDLGRDIAWRERGPLLVIGNPPWVTNCRAGKPGEHPATRPGAISRACAGWRPAPARRISTWPRRSGSSWPSSWPTSNRRSRSCARHRWPGASSSLRTAPASRLRRRRFAESTRPDGLARPSTRACFASRSASDRSWFLAGQGRVMGNVPAQLAAGLQTDDSIPTPTHPRLRQPERGRSRSIMGFADGWLIADDELHSRWAFADGVCPLEWRQGLKHDAAAVMELLRDTATGQWRNRDGEVGRRRAGICLSAGQGNRSDSSGGEPARASDRGHSEVPGRRDRTTGDAGASALALLDNRTPTHSRNESRRSIAAAPAFRFSASDRTASRRTRSRSPACTRTRGSGRWARSTGSPRCWMTPATSSPARPPKRRRS